MLSNSWFFKEPLVPILSKGNFVLVPWFRIWALFFKFQTCDFGFGTIFQIQELLGLVWKQDPIPCMHYTLSKAKNYICIGFYNKLILESWRYQVLQQIQLNYLFFKINLLANFFKNFNFLTLKTCHVLKILLMGLGSMQKPNLMIQS
jgi:hypothetical protein